MQFRVKQRPAWLSMLFGFLLVLFIGCIDYLTGDYSLLVFYAVPISLAAWHIGCSHSLALAAAAGGARLVSDYYSYEQSTFRYGNSAQDMIFLFLVGLLVSAVRTLLADEGSRPG